MKIKLGVCEFGKIQSAEVDITNFTVFVGNNNSGKTYMMQLIYGVLKELPKIFIDLGEWSLDLQRVLHIGKTEFLLYEKTATKYLREHKEEIIQKTFHKDIPIKDLYLKLYDITESATISYKTKKVPFETEIEEIDESNIVNDEKTDKVYHTKDIITADIAINNEHKIIEERKISFEEGVSNKFIDRICTSYVISNVLDIDHSDHIFFPASRTGLLLLYKSFFVEKDESKLLLTQQNYGNEFGLSQPVYEFLRFLMKYTPNEMAIKKNEKIIHFIEKHLIDGTVAKNGDEDIYSPKHSDVQIPLYLASSIVNELTPVLRMLMGRIQYKTVLYDEIETCLHPSKQTQMARLLIRLNNAGKRLIVSTHSDTMATKLNNLLLLSATEISETEKCAKLERLHLEKEDLLQKKEVHIYQFENQENGSSFVKELEFRKVPFIGYDFSQFTDSAQDLYDESLIIAE